MADRKRLDLTLLDLKLASTRTKAQELIASGMVLVNGEPVKQPGAKVDPSARVELLGEEHPYVSRGGLKLEAALRAFSIDVVGKRALDVGQSTGGFTHCLLRSGAAAVVGVEVGQGQLASSLRSDPRVATLEKQDIRALSPERIAPPFELFVVDLSFISLSLVLPVLPAFLRPGADGVVLVKPQFEVGPGKVGAGGIVRDAAAREDAVERIRQVSERHHFTVAGSLQSPVAGGDGNQEFLLHLRLRV